MREPEDHENVAFPRLDDAQIAVLEPFATARHLADGEPLFQAGDRRGGFFVVLEGAVEIVDRSGDQIRTVALHGPREFTGDIDIMSRRRPVVSAVARGETDVLHVSSHDVRRIIGSRPALGEVILRAFIARREALVASGFQGLRVIGSGTSRDTFRLREFLTRNHVPFTWIDLDAEPGFAALLAGFGVEERDTPVVAYGSLPLLLLDGGERVPARCVLIATGAEYRKLDVPGRERFDGLGVYYAATHMELVACQGADVVVVGGGNSAGQATMFLAENTRRVLLLLRGGDIYKSMSSYLADRVRAAKNVEVLYHTEVRRMNGEGHLEAVEVEDNRSGAVRTVVTPGLFTFIGAVPRTDWLPSQVRTDARGFILTGRAAVRPDGGREPALLETSVPGVFAAGDVRAGSTKRVASAVGEGSMVVKLVHEHLASRLDES